MNLYSGIMRCRNYFYKKKWLQSNKLNCPVVAVGNISVGGTGKTAVVDYLLSSLKEEGVNVGVVSRGYKGTYKTTVEVDLKHQNASHIFGDEVSMLKWKHPEVPIFVGKKRYDAGVELLKKYPNTQVILADDAFQHLGLHRDLNICLLDMTDDPSNYKVIPFGRLREAFAPAIKRADIVLMTKANLAKPTTIEYWFDYLQGINFKGPIYKVNFINSSFIHLRSQKKESNLTGKAIAFCGLARPEVFANALRQNSNIKLLEALAFKDHISYNKKHIKSLLLIKEKLSADFFITTAKDAIKLLNETELIDHTWMADLELEILGVSNYEAKFTEEIIRIIRS